MMDMFFLPTPYGAADVQVFMGAGRATGAGVPEGTVHTYRVPRGKTMLDIVMVGAGGDGGNGVVGAVSTAAGGGGGASGSFARCLIPISRLPYDILHIYFSARNLPSSQRNAVYCSPVFANTTTNAVSIIVATLNGGPGGNAAGATAGTAGAVGTALTATAMLLGAQAGSLVIYGSAAGTGGGTTGAAGNLTFPTTGLPVSGGAGGAGLGAAGSAGFTGGNVTLTTAVWPYGSSSGSSNGWSIAGSPPANATSPPEDGSHGIQIGRFPIVFGFGGAGGGSSHGSATGVGLKGGNGGDGAPGCGGGGGGGALTGSVQGLGGRGGPGFCIITAT